MTAKSEQKARSHATILASAARVLRERGIAGASVADVMRGAGLTVGGFYAHFASKEKLIDAVLRATSALTRDRLFANLDSKPAADRAEVVLKRYLSPAHRDDLAAGCPLPAVVGEVATTAPEQRAVLAEQLDDLVEQLAEHLPTRPLRRQLALGLVAMMYGGLALSRAVRDQALSDEILKACRAIGRVAIQAT